MAKLHPLPWPPVYISKLDQADYIQEGQEGLNGMWVVVKSGVKRNQTKGAS